MLFVAINRSREEYLVSDSFSILWHAVVRDRKLDRRFGDPSQAWEIGYGLDEAGHLPAIIGAPIATFIGTTKAVVVCQNSTTKIHRV